ncbi:tRNA (adenosine(37)-N6)-threonylcarbamoyltransferase complex dimerization subunit type 1 TsaB [Dechloromonas sp. ZY10]|uniref:tRNA (adenosine(37)-N6)-threonylcarbamoyltransferase complex dimerization subunit type 1 TsaB n=1 Tax=Dechloromonas aquae TaxID=2664436 RepID=UPI003526FC8A
MLILALETSTDFGTCALWRDGEVTERICPPGRPHSETLLPLVRDLLAGAAVGIADLDAIAFGCGPGAFTGLRVACGAAQGLAMVAGTPLLPVVSLETMVATSRPAPGQQVLALLDARMGEVYLAPYRPGSTGCPQLLAEIRVQRPEAIELASLAGWHACGNALTAYPVLQEKLLAAGLTVEAGCLPRAAVVAALAAPRVAAGEGIDAALAAPLYIRDKVAKTVAERLAEGGKA